MFTDIAGYTAQMSKSESKTLKLLEKNVQFLNPSLKNIKAPLSKKSAMVLSPILTLQ